MLTENIDAVASYRLCLSARLIRTDKETGFVLNSNGIRQLKGALYLDILERCASNTTHVFQLIESLSGLYVDTHVWHATTVLAEQGYLEIPEETDEKYVNYPTFNHLPQLEWLSCMEKDIPVISFLNDLDSEKARLEYLKAREGKYNWLPVVWVGPVPTIGPVFTSDSFCLECLNFRLRENRSFIIWLRNYLPSGEISPVQWIEKEKLPEFGKQLQEFARSWSPDGPLRDKLVSLLPGNSAGMHQVMKRPECRVCGDPLLFAKVMETPVRIIAAGNSCSDYTLGFRSKPPADTWKELAHHISPVTGIVDEITPTGSGNVSVFPVYRTRFSTFPREASPDWSTFKMNVLGKGRTAIASRVSALCEGIERASARYRGDEPIRSASLKEMGSRAIAPHLIQHFSREQLQNPQKTRSLGPVPQALFHTGPIDWLPGWSLRFHERRFVPADTVLLYRPYSTSLRAAVFESNGLSAGNTLEEAVLQGLLELIERDAVAIWWFNRLHRPPFDLQLMTGDEWFGSTLRNLRKEQFEIFLLDLTMDTHIPVVAAIGKYQQGWLYGFGCHFDPRLAASRALTELVQVRAVMKPVMPPEDWKELDYLYPHSSAKVIRNELPSGPTATNTAALLQSGIDRLTKIGLDTIVVNCSRPDINVPVVKVFAPGLRAFRPRFGPGRLFDVPVQLGLLDTPRSSSDLTPFWLTL